MADKPNVFMLVVDSLRADAISGDHIATPNIDSLIEKGSTFEQCVCTATTTTPAFSSLLTGCYPPKHGVRGLQGYRLSSQVQTLAETFKGAGYNTYAEVTGPLLPEVGILRGFDQANHRQAYRMPFFYWRDDVIEKLRSYVEPWFMMLHIWEVHRPYRSPPDFEKRQDKTGYERAVAATDDWLAPVFEAAGDALTVVTGDHGEDYKDTPLEMTLVKAARKGRRVFRVNKWSKKLDQRLAGMEVGHGFALWENLVRVPLVISGWGVPTARVQDQVRHIDLLPTLADLCGIPIPAGVDGRSLRPLMDGEGLPEEPAYMEAVGVKLEGNRIEGVRTTSWKFLRSELSKPALYKLDDPTGPDERKNVIRRYPEVATSLEAVIEKVDATELVAESGMTSDEEAVVEQHLKDLGYL